MAVIDKPTKAYLAALKKQRAKAKKDPSIQAMWLEGCGVEQCIALGIIKKKGSK